MIDREGRSDLHYAARDGDLSAAQRLIRGGADVNLADKRGWTPLHFAAQAQSVEVTALLISAGAAVDAPDIYGNTPLARATFDSRGRGAVIAALRSAGADPRKKNTSGVSPVELARTIANYDVAQFFKDVADA